MVVTLSSYMQKPTDNEPELPSTSAFGLRKGRAKDGYRIGGQPTGVPTGGSHRGHQFRAQLAKHQMRAHPQIQMQQRSAFRSALDGGNITPLNRLKNEYSSRQYIEGCSTVGQDSSIPVWRHEDGSFYLGRTETKNDYEPKPMVNPYQCGPDLANPGHTVPLIPRSLEEYFGIGGNVPYVPPGIPTRDLSPKLNFAVNEYLKNLQRNLDVAVHGGLNPGALQTGNCPAFLPNMSELLQQQPYIRLLMELRASIAAQQHGNIAGLESVPQQWISTPSSASLFPKDSDALQNFGESLQPAPYASLVNPADRIQMTEVTEPPTLFTNNQESQYSDQPAVKSQSQTLPDLLYVRDVPDYLRKTRPYLSDEEVLAILCLARGADIQGESKED